MFSTLRKMRPSDPARTGTRSSPVRPTNDPSRTTLNVPRMAKTTKRHHTLSANEQIALHDRTGLGEPSNKAETRSSLRQSQRRISEENDGKRQADLDPVRLWPWPSEKKSVLSREKERRLFLIRCIHVWVFWHYRSMQSIVDRCKERFATEPSVDPRHIRPTGFPEHAPSRLR